MTEIQNAVTLQDIREIVRQIVERFRPQKVSVWFIRSGEADPG